MWELSRATYDRFPGEDASDVEALSFAVGLPGTDALQGRQPAGGQVASNTIVGVRFSSAIRADAQVADYDRALEREIALVAVISAITGGPRYRLASVNRAVTSDGLLFVGDVRFMAFHGYPLG